ncbi:MAG: DUF4139 domain-containing protein [Myxococcales bacterium]|nr:DUF4139 domain-containing protein [Polyangiaceae bacterium]MDW8251363.1 DUF4139 domain-containing protein [Myxococcales bacterium]
MPILCSSTIDRVTVYARGAVVTRSLKLPLALPDGLVELEVPGVTALAEPGSLRLSLEGPRTALSVRALPINGATVQPGPLPEKVRELRHRIDRLKDEIQALQERRERLSQLAPNANPSLVSSMEARFKAALGAGALIEELLARLDARWFELEESLREATQRLASMELSLRQTSTTRRGEEGTTRSLLIRLGGSGKLARAEVSYVVAPARWWPLYTLRVFEGHSASLGIEALVAQLSGEDWSSAQLSFATADLVHDARMPELRSLRLGRTQPPPRTGYRPPPTGLDQLFAAHDRYFPELIPPRPIPENDPEVNYTLRDILRGGVLTEGASHRELIPEESSVPEELNEEDLLEQETPDPRVREGSMVGGVTMMTRSPDPRAGEGGRIENEKNKDISVSQALAPPLARVSGQNDDVLAGGRARGGGGSSSSPEPLEPDESYLDLARLRIGGPEDRHRRGRLYLAIEDARSLAAMRNIEAVQPPVSAVRDPRHTRGQFAYRYDAAARGTVPSDGVPHLVPVVTAQAPMRATFRTLPRESSEVFREAQFTNPFDAPLLAGPVQVYVDHSLLTTTSLERVGKGGVVKVGLGVEPRIRVARNVQVLEGSSGLLGGATVVQQTIRIDLVSSLGHPVEIEVIDRTPISDDKQITVERLPATPEAQPYDQSERGEPIRGGLRWLVSLPAGGSMRIEHGFRITFPAKFELTGGNRRD